MIIRLILIPMILYYLWVWIFVFKFNVRAMLLFWKKPKVDPQSIVKTENMIPDVMGKSKEIVRDTLPDAASSGHAEKQVDKPDTFAGEENTKEENPGISKVVPGEEMNEAFSNSIVESIPAEYDDDEEDFPEEPEESLEVTGESASGASFDEIGLAVRVVEGKETGEKEKAEACHTLQKLNGTEIYKAFITQLKDGEKRIDVLMSEGLEAFERKNRFKKELTYENFDLSDFV